MTATQPLARWPLDCFSWSSDCWALANSDVSSGRFEQAEPVAPGLPDTSVVQQQVDVSEYL